MTDHGSLQPQDAVQEDKPAASVADILDRAADLIEPEGAWTQGALARDEAGLEALDPEDPDACCWCVAGAIQHVAGGGWPDSVFDLYHAARRSVLVAVGMDENDRIAIWNDARHRTQAEVVAALRQAAAAERALGEQA